MTTTTNTTTRLTLEQQAAVIYWPEVAGIPIIEADTGKKHVNVHGWQNLDLTKVDFRAKLANGDYDNGIAIRLGKTLSGQYYSFALDFDGWDAVEEWFGDWEQVLELSKKTRIEWHGDDRGRIHCIFLAKEPIANTSHIHIRNSQLEIRCEKELLFVSPSVHKHGNPYTVIGTNEIAILNKIQLLTLQAKIDKLSEGYMSDENKQEYIRWLEDPNTVLGEGEGRHPALVILGLSYYYRYKNGWKDMTDDQRRKKLWEWNQRQNPPKPEKEFNEVWKWIIDNHRKRRDEQRKQWEDERRKAVVEERSKEDPNDDPDFGESINAELKGSVFYVTKLKPLTLVVAYSKTKMLIEASIKSYDKTEFGKNNQEDSIKVKYLNQKKLYLTCIPRFIIKHKNPLSFLDAATKYTITFVDSVGNHFTFKTLSEIISGLRVCPIRWRRRRFGCHDTSIYQEQDTRRKLRHGIYWVLF